MSSVSIIGVGSKVSALTAIGKIEIACDGGAKGRNAVNVVLRPHGAELAASV